MSPADMMPAVAGNLRVDVAAAMVPAVAGNLRGIAMSAVSGDPQWRATSAALKASILTAAP